MTMSILYRTAFVCACLLAVKGVVSFTIPSSSSSVLFCSGQHHERKFESSLLHAFNLRDADMMEELIGGERYEMVPLPDSMVDTTLFVGNLNEFVKDGDLSDFFQTVSILQSVPACVARRPNFDSLGYGFVTFPTVEEKEAALMRFHGCSFMGKSLKVEEIRDHPKMGRVRVPEKIVAYVSGSIKKTRNGQTNTMRRISRLDDASKKSKKKKQKQQNKINNKKKKKKTIKLSGPDQAEFDRAIRKGYVTLESTGYRNGRKGSALACAHREWCDEREKPQIVLCKASGGRPRDCIIVDLSPLRVTGDEDFLLHHKIDILTIATNAGMELRTEEGEDEDDDDDGIVCTESSDGTFNCVMTMGGSNDDDVSKHISKIPVQSLGIFEGERSHAKAMSRDLARLWNIPIQPESTTTIVEHSSTKDTNNNKKHHHHNKRQAHHRRRDHRRRGRRQRELDIYSHLHAC